MRYKFNLLIPCNVILTLFAENPFFLMAVGSKVLVLWVVLA
jgi:hypothetical protein